MSSAKFIDRHDAEVLLNLAVESIKQGLQARRALNVDLDKIPDSLCQPGASFVTLKLHGQLRGCIGHLEASQELVLDVVDNAALAAFRDPRFAPLTASELGKLEVSLSILSTPEPLAFSSEEDLLRIIRPGVDGLILREGERQGTFLPSVWESLPEPEDFLRHLKQKAGLPEDYWSDRLQVLRYTAQHIKSSTAGGVE